jgi:diadenosine tetraphosphate (Ap4A) HIT family hydrolase
MGANALKENASCFVCRKHRGEEVVPGGPIFEDRLVYVSHTAPPPDGRAYLGWCFVEPHRHAPGLADLSDEEAETVGRLVTQLSRALISELDAEHVYAFVLGHHVPHLHVHVIARHVGAPEAYWGMNVDKWPQAPRGDEAEIAALVARLRIRLMMDQKSR